MIFHSHMLVFDDYEGKFPWVVDDIIGLASQLKLRRNLDGIPWEAAPVAVEVKPQGVLAKKRMNSSANRTMLHENGLDVCTLPENEFKCPLQ